MEKRTVERDEEVIFTNWTDSDFSQSYDQGNMGGKDGKSWIAKRKIYTFKAGKSYYIPFYLAELTAKHLADREYTKSFNKKLEELKMKVGDQIDRRTLENRVSSSPEVTKLSKQQMIDKCVEFIPQDLGGVESVKPEEVKMREVVLRRDERAQELKEKYPEIEVQMNKKALEQKNEEFED